MTTKEGVNGDTGNLLRQSREGSAASLGTLLDSYKGFLQRQAAARLIPALRSKLAPSDIVQESMLIAARDFGTFRGESDAELRAWLLRIVTSQIVNGLRRFAFSEKRRLDRETSGDSSLRRQPANDDSPSQEAIHRESAAALVESMARLPAELRDVVQARYFEGLTFPEIAARLSLPATTCRRRWLEAIDTIRRDMGVEP